MTTKCVVKGRCDNGQDFIPRGDAEFNGWLGNFVIYANANLAGLWLVAGDMRQA